MVDSSENPGRVSDDRVYVSGAQVHGGEAFHDLVSQANGCINAYLQRDFIGDAGSIRICQLDITLARELDDLESRPVHENDLHAQRTQHGQVKENVGKVIRSSHLAIEGNDEYALPETGNVLEDLAEVGDVHFDAESCRDSNLRCALKPKVAVELCSND